MRSMMKFSNGGDVTSLQMWYLTPIWVSGTYTSWGLIWTTYVMQDFWEEILSEHCLVYNRIIKFRLYLIFINVICKLSLAEFIESNNDKSHEDVDEEEGENNKIHDIIYRHLSSEPWQRTLVLVCGWHGVLENSVKENCINHHPQVSPAGHSLNPSLWCLYRKQRDHSYGAVVVVEGSPVPDSLDNVGSGVVVEIIHEIFSPEVTMSVRLWAWHHQGCIIPGEHSPIVTML